MTVRDVTVVLAATDAGHDARASADAFAVEVAGRGTVLVADATRRGCGVAESESVTVLRRPAGTLAPVLWRDGLLASGSTLVAFTTAAMLPQHGWLDALTRTLDETGAAGVGGPIEPAAGLAAFDRAVYLQRYVSYLRPWPESARIEPPGDNALYRRADLAPVADAWSDGFWEVDVHRALRAAGRSLAMAEGGSVSYTGGARPVATLAQRYRHARRYGAGRSSGLGVATRGLRAAAAPAVPLVLARRTAAALRARGQPVARWAPAAPGLAAVLAAWAAGEAVGTLTAA